MRGLNADQIRTGLISPLSWDNATLVYNITGTFNTEELKQIYLGMATIESKTCIRFRPVTPHDIDQSQSYVAITNQVNEGCSSYVEKQIQEKHTPQPLNLEKGCLEIGIVMHELMHALGFIHEQNRPDRDEYVEYHWENIQPNLSNNFAKYAWKNVTTFNLGYDYSSIMHYESDAFTVGEGLATITPLVDGVQIGQREKLSQKDVIKLNRMYGCYL